MAIGVRFDNDWRPPEEQKKLPTMVRLVMRWSAGRVKTEAQANIILLAITVIFFVTAAIVAFVY